MATKTTSIALGEELANYARSKVASGAFGSTSEVVRDALRRVAERDARLAALEKVVQEGLDSGIDEDFDFDLWMEQEFPEAECHRAAG